jgi:hypothetical protein
MVDLETLGTSAGCIILSIGACTFDRQFQFYEKISVMDSDRQGFTENPDTMAWWSKQDPAAFKEATSGHLSVEDALGEFSDWYRRLPAPNVYIWGNGADFDLPILREYYEVMKMKVPWKPFNGRCYRTLKNLYPRITIPANPNKHNALEDALWQAQHACEILSQHFHRE